VLDSFEENINWDVKEVKFDGSTQLLRSNTKGVPLGPSPGSPLDDHTAAVTEDLLCEIPLKVLNALAGFAVPEVDTEGFHPLVGTKANGRQVLLDLPGMSGFAGAG